VFEIGISLREARLRQGRDLGRVEADTKIRAKYLQALEDERFDLLPAETYVKGFLRAYAEHLGLDGQLYVDEFNSRYATADEPLITPRRLAPRRTRASESNFVAVALAGIVAVTILIVVAWQFGSSSPSQNAESLTPVTPPPATSTETEPAGDAVTTTETEAPATAPAKAQTARLVLRAARGDCWMQVRAGSATGELLFEGTLEQGQTQRFARKRVWIQLGAGEVLDVRVNGKQLEGFPSGAVIVLVTAKGARTVTA
jgi:cytoskeleton protein RodZ